MRKTFALAALAVAGFFAGVWAMSVTVVSMYDATHTEAGGLRRWD